VRRRDGTGEGGLVRSGQVGQWRQEIGLVPRRVDHRQPFLQLRDGDPPVGQRLVELGCGTLPVGVGDPDSRWVRRRRAHLSRIVGNALSVTD
jgi:hypothetical protein